MVIVEAIQQSLLFDVWGGMGGHRGEANTLPTRLETQWMPAVNQTIASGSKYMNLLSVRCCNTAATLDFTGCDGKGGESEEKLLSAVRR